MSVDKQSPEAPQARAFNNVESGTNSMVRDRLESADFYIREAVHAVDRDEHSSPKLSQAIDNIEMKYKMALPLSVRGETNKALESIFEMERFADEAKECVRHDHALSAETRKAVLRMHHELARAKSELRTLH
jgi:hypothetical protein